MFSQKRVIAPSSKAHISIPFGEEQRLQPAPDIIAPGGVVMTAAILTIHDLVAVFTQDWLHTAVVLQQRIKPADIHPQLELIVRLLRADQVHGGEVAALGLYTPD